MNTLEKEIKLGKVGISDEYQTFEDNQTIATKVALLALKYDLTIAESNDLKINDTYYDTDTFEILNSKSTFRKREVNDSKEFTIKIPISINSNTFERLEITESVGIEDDENEVFKSIVSKNNLNTEIKPVVIIKNQRFEIVLERNGIKITLCFDRYRFYSIARDIESEYTYLIEIEYIVDQDVDTEVVLEKLISDIKIEFHVNPETMTKYKQAVKWLHELIGQ
jgi:uncharacterized protein YjbK